MGVLMNCFNELLQYADSVIKSTQVLFQAMCLPNIDRIDKAPVF